jgi:hypothetical protein
MMTAYFSRRTFFALALQPLLCAGVSSAAEKRPEPFNRIVAIVDGSGSFKSRVADAVARLVALLDQMARTKVHRWDSGVDHVTIVALDALPAVIWQGTVRDLKEMNRNAWTERFKARTDFTGCTDVSAAFRVAAEHLDGDPRYIGKYLFVFSDLVDEPPAALSVRNCRPPKRPSPPPQDFPWEALRDVSVSALWVPADQILAWQRAVTAAGLGATFKLYSASESEAVEVASPPRRELHRTDEDAERDRARYADYAKRGAGWLFGGTMVVVAVVGGILLAIRTLAQRRAARPAPPPAAVRPLPLPRGERPIPPLPISGPNPAGRPPAQGNGRAA